MADVVPQIKVSSDGRHDYYEPAGSPTTRTAEGMGGERPWSSGSEGNQGASWKSQGGGKVIRNSSTRTAISKATSPPPERPSTAIDPLSHHILRRTNTENTIPQRLRTSGALESPTGEAGAPGSNEGAASIRQTAADPTRADNLQVRDKKKGVSFLSRFSIIGGKKKDDEDPEDDENELEDCRTEGMNAQVFSTSRNASGYIPQHKEPPSYIKVGARYKHKREFDRMFLAQELGGTRQAGGDADCKVPGLMAVEVSSSRPSSRPASKEHTRGGAIWTTEFSIDGKYLAAAGQDQIVRVWSVISTAQERANHEREEDLSGSHAERLSAPVFRSKPTREFEGHTSTVLDLSWSKNNFLLSSSMDKTVRLWHVSRAECLCTFKHKDFVTSIAFHPRDDRFFLAGSLDSVLRLWSIPDKSVAFWTQLPDLITAVAFTPDGRTAMAGVLSGLCLFYETEGLKYHTQIHVRSSRGKNAKGSKITGIRTAVYPAGDANGEVKILISSNDSRVRLYNLRDKNLELKFRGHANACSQIRASFSDDSRYVVCGSEDRKTYIWSTGAADGDNKDRRPLEIFAAHADVVTTSIMAPLATRRLLAASGDPIYDLCNPPPVTLLSRAETTFAAAEDGAGAGSSSEPVAAAPPSSGYVARSAHRDGNIVITADMAGGIKVFRQDCAEPKRREAGWDAASTFSRKLQRRNSRREGGGASRRSSLSLHAPSVRSGGKGDAQIMHWANAVLSHDAGGARSVRSVGTAGRSAQEGSGSESGSVSVSPEGRRKEGGREAKPGRLLPTPSFSLKQTGEGAGARPGTAGSWWRGGGGGKGGIAEERGGGSEGTRSLGSSER